MKRATMVLHEKSPAATGSSTYGSCVFFVYPDLWLFYLVKHHFSCNILRFLGRSSLTDLDYALLGKCYLGCLSGFRLISLL